MSKIWVYIAVLIIPLVIITCARREVKVVEEEPIVKEYVEEEVIEPEIEEVKILLKFTTIHFDFDKYDIRPGYAKILEDNADVLKAHPNLKLLIEGHCDERGTNEYNLALGEKRANAAKNYLIRLGISRDRLSTVSYGEEKPVDLGHNETAWAENRRADFVVR